jgi:PAS domain S-box-containing protein
MDEIDEDYLKSLIASIPGEAAIYAVEDKCLRTLFYTPTIPLISGLTKEEYDKIVAKDAVAIVNPLDASFVAHAILRTIRAGKDIDIWYRIFHKEKKYIWVHAKAKLIGTMNSVPILLSVFQNIANVNASTDVIIDHSTFLSYVINKEDFELLYANAAALKRWGKEGQSYLGEKCYHFIKGGTTPCPWCPIVHSPDGNAEVKDFHSPGTGYYLDIEAHPLDWYGRNAEVLFASDVTERYTSSIAAKTETENLNKLVQTIPAGICVYKREGDRISRLVANPWYCRMIGVSDETLFKEQFDDFYKRTHPDDLAFVKKEYKELVRQHNVMSFSYRTLNMLTHSYIWVRADGISYEEPDGVVLAYVSYTNVTKEKEDEAKLTDSEYRYRKALEGGHLAVWEFNIPDRCIVSNGNSFFDFSSGDINSEKKIIRNVPECFYPLIKEEDLNKFKEFFSDLIIGKKETGSLEFWSRISLDKSLVCRHISYSTVFSPDHKPIKAYFFGFDVTERKKNEEDLQAFRAKFDLAAEGSSLAFWEYNIKERKIESSNGAIDKIIGGNSRENLGVNVPFNFLPLIDERDRSKVLAFYSDIKKGVEVLSCEFRIRTTLGELRWIRISYSMVFDSRHLPVKAFGVGTDITEQKKEEEKYNAFLEQILTFNHSSSLFVHLNLSQNMMQGSESLKDGELGVEEGTVDDFLSGLKINLFSLDDEKVFANSLSREKLLNDFFAGKNNEEVNYRTIKGGLARYKKASVHMVQNPKNGDVEAIFEESDITDQILDKTIVEKVTKNIYEFMALLDIKRKVIHFRQMPGSVFSVPVTESFDYEKDFIQGFDKRVIPEEAESCKKKAAIAKIVEELQTKAIYTFSFSQKIPGQSSSRRKMLSFMYLDDSKSGILVLRSDVDQSYKADQERLEEIKTALNKAERASSAKSEFLSNISHDMRTPLNGIIGFTDLALEIKEEKERTDYLEKIKSSGLLLRDLINDTLELSKIETQKVYLKLESVESNKIFESVYSSVQSLAEEKGVELKLDSKAYKGYIMADVVKCEKVILNLATNAVKFTPKGGKVNISITSSEQEQDKVLYTLVVADTGIGISPEFMKVLFEPFAQEHPSSSIDSVGTGLGLAIVKNIVKMIGGTIDVVSKVNEGTTFTVKASFMKSNPPKKTIEEKDLNNKTVLLCEDNQMNMDITSKILQHRGILVIKARDGQEGISLFMASRLFSIDAILMDIRMPNVDGLEAARKIRELQRADAKEVPIIALSANAFDEDILKSKEAGMNDHLSKPIEPEEVYKALEKYIKER